MSLLILLLIDRPVRGSEVQPCRLRPEVPRSLIGRARSSLALSSSYARKQVTRSTCPCATPPGFCPAREVPDRCQSTQAWPDCEKRDEKNKNKKDDAANGVFLFFEKLCGKKRFPTFSGALFYTGNVLTVSYFGPPLFAHRGSEMALQDLTRYSRLYNKLYPDPPSLPRVAVPRDGKYRFVAPHFLWTPFSQLCFNRSPSLEACAACNRAGGGR